MDCDCNSHMQLKQTEDEYKWNDDIPEFSIYENWECTECGSCEKVNVTGSYICENNP